MAINKFNRLCLTFDLSVKVAHTWVPPIDQNILISETTMPIETEFHFEDSYDKLAKFI